MSFNARRVFIIELLTLFVVLLDIFVTNIMGNYGMILFLGIILGGSILLIGYSKNRNLYRRDILLNIFIYCFLYYLITYLSGLFIGFLKSGYSFKISIIFLNTFPVILSILVTELLRYVLLFKSGKNKCLLVLSCILFTFIDVKLIAYAYDLHSFSGIIKMTYTSFLPLLSKNIFLTFVCYKFGYVPNVIYRLLMEIPVYLLPIVPNIDAYFSIVINLLLPALLLFLIYKEFFHKKKKVDVRKKDNNYVSIFLLVLIVLIIFLTCGLFKYYALAIGSDSMSPNIKKGDIVIVQKVKNDKLGNIKIGDVLVYKHNNMVIVHRVVDVFHSSDSYSFRTRGDYNTADDVWAINEDAVIGTAILRIPYLGIPTVWLSEKV